jgi:hypothetical protein
MQSKYYGSKNIALNGKSENHEECKDLFRLCIVD